MQILFQNKEEFLLDKYIMDNNKSNKSKISYFFKKNLIPLKSYNKKNKIRLGRGQGSGKGGTCGRGHKGAKSRSGYSKKIGFEGGQMPLHRRIPKFGFNRISKIKKIFINLDTIQNYIDKKRIDGKKIINKKNLFRKNFKKNILLKILGRGKLKTPITIYANKFSKSALKHIKKIGGKFFLE